MLYRALPLVIAGLAAAHGEIISLHGSGTTNPSKLYWQSMDLIAERAKQPLHMTYRAVGSSTGQKEFLGASNGNVALNHFGSGDIPMTAARFAAVEAAGRKMVHMPFAVGGIGVFHSVPSGELGGALLDLTGCLLAKIFSRSITSWDHPEIRDLNPTMTATGAIKVVHRVHGSSSTAGFTEYLSQKCPASWSLGAGSTIAWPAGTFEGQGSGGMADFIATNEYAIGYIDAGHGHESNLGEIALRNKDGAYLTTKQADIGAAATVALSAGSVIPADPSADFSAVNLYDMSGPTTWPITMISYLYLDQDLRTVDANTAGLLRYFIDFILSDAGQALAVANKFVALPQALKDYNVLTLATLVMPVAAPTFTTETSSSTQPETGAGPFVISGKRRSYSEVERTRLSATQETLVATDAADAAAASTTITTRFGEWTIDEKQFTAGAAAAALAIAILGFVIAMCACVIACKSSRASAPRSREIAAPVRQIEISNKADSV